MTPPEYPAAGTRREYPAAGTVLAGLAVVATGAVLLAPRPAALVAAPLLTLVLPGAALARALMPGRRWSVAEWCMLVPGLSLFTLVLGGLGLAAAGRPLTQRSWALLAAAVTVVAAVAGQFRTWYARRRAGGTGDPEAQRRFPGGPLPRRAPDSTATGERITFRRAVLRLSPLLLAASLLAGAGWYALRAAEQRHTEPFTALVMVPAFATEAPGASRTVTVGIQCREKTATDYLLRVRGTAGFEERLTVRLRPDEDWARRLAVPSTGRVTADLHRDGGATPYRTVFLDSPQ